MSTSITPVGFKSGKDLDEEPGADEEEQVTCVDCGQAASDQLAYERGWQLVPAVCPDCLRWVAIAHDSCCHGSPA
jgi:hypothetical protein